MKPAAAQARRQPPGAANLRRTSVEGSESENGCGLVRDANGAVRASSEQESAFVVMLPYPPTLNMLWRRVGAKTLLSAEGRRYAQVVALCVKQAWHLETPVPPAPHRVTLLATPPDRRRRDLDNLPKAVLDNVYRVLSLDDSVIEDLRVCWRRDGRPACIEVRIESTAATPVGGYAPRAEVLAFVLAVMEPAPGTEGE